MLKQQAADLESGNSGEQIMSWSIHYAEKPIAAVAARSDENAIQSDLMKFSANQSDLMKFSKSGEEEAEEDLTEKMSDLMKFSTTSAAVKDEVTNIIYS